MRVQRARIEVQDSEYQCPEPQLMIGTIHLAKRALSLNSRRSRAFVCSDFIVLHSWYLLARSTIGVSTSPIGFECGFASR